MKQSNFQKDLAFGKTGEQLAQQYLAAMGYEIEDVSNNREYFVKDIDFFADNGQQRMAVEVKTDSYMHISGNAVIETMSNVGKGNKGWFYYTQATHIFYVEKATGVIHCVRFDELQQLFNEKKSQFKKKISTFKESGKYTKQTEFYLVPLSELKKLPHYVRLDKQVVAKHRKESK